MVHAGRGIDLGPNDYASDRYNSFTVRLFSSFGGILSSWVILVIEWIMLEKVSCGTSLCP